MRAAFFVFAVSMAFSVAIAQEPSVFRSGTRLVEVDAVVRSKHGPVTGLTKDDFTLYDCKPEQRDRYNPFNPCKGKRQPIQEFREVNGASVSPALPATSAAVSNREPAATIVLLDQLNTPFDLKGYERLRVAEFLPTIGDQHRIALYSMGRNLRILQDFTDDPEKLMAAMAKIDSGDELTFAQNSPGDRDNGDIDAIEAKIQLGMKRDITSEAIQTIVRHMEGVPGRKNLVWIAQTFGPLNDAGFGPPGPRQFLAQANIAVYPVKVWTGPHILQWAWREFGAQFGGIGFDDAEDALAAVRAGEEDSMNYYVLGFYPAEADLDGKTHQLTLEVSGQALSSRGIVKSALDLRYRQLYLATKPGSEDAGANSEISDIFLRPVDSSAIGLTGSIVPDPIKAGTRRIQVTVDLADVQLQREGDRWAGSLQVAMRLESYQKNARLVTPSTEGTVPIRLTDAKLQAIRASGFRITWPLAPDAKPGAAHVVVEDTANGRAGSVRVPIPAGK
jgi:VWFA-related protein